MKTLYNDISEQIVYTDSLITKIDMNFKSVKDLNSDFI